MGMGEGSYTLPHPWSRPELNRGLSCSSLNPNYNHCILYLSRTLQCIWRLAGLLIYRRYLCRFAGAGTTTLNLSPSIGSGTLLLEFLPAVLYPVMFATFCFEAVAAQSSVRLLGQNHYDLHLLFVNCLTSLSTNSGCVFNTSCIKSKPVGPLFDTARRCHFDGI